MRLAQAFEAPILTGQHRREHRREDFEAVYMRIENDVRQALSRMTGTRIA
jgi:hypothetical protein